MPRCPGTYNSGTFSLPLKLQATSALVDVTVQHAGKIVVPLSLADAARVETVHIIWIHKATASLEQWRSTVCRMSMSASSMKFRLRGPYCHAEGSLIWQFGAKPAHFFGRCCKLKVVSIHGFVRSPRTLCNCKYIFPTLAGLLHPGGRH